MSARAIVRPLRNPAIGGHSGRTDAARAQFVLTKAESLLAVCSGPPSLAPRATVDNLRLGLPTVAHAPVARRERRLEAPPGFEPGMEVLQTSALPLGDGAGWKRSIGAGVVRPRLGARTTATARLTARVRLKADTTYDRGLVLHSGPGPPTPLRGFGATTSAWLQSGSWSGKRDSNPRLRPWQGRTLPLSYSRPRRNLSVTHAFQARQPPAIA